MPLDITRRGFLGATAVAAAQAQTPRTTAKRPNLILCMADELRAESIACYGHPLVKTPNMDRLAAQGTRFAQCHVQNTVCEPSRCSFLTGWPVHVRGHRSLYYGLHPDEPNLFRYLKEAGYDVFWFGKNDLLAPESFALSVTHAEAGKGPTMFTKNLYPLDDPHYYAFLFEKGADPRHTSDYSCVQSATEIMQREGDKPFCIFLPLIYPHPPYSAPAEYHDKYSPSALAPLRPANTPGLPRFHQALRKKMRLDQLNDKDFRQVQAVYLGMVSYADWVLGELMESIEKSQRTNDTALFYFADHGDYAGDYGLVEKWPNAMHDPLTHIPLIARVPGGQQGHVANEIVELFDVMATCLDLAGIEARHTHFARSLMPQLKGEPGDAGRAAFCEGGYNTNEPQCFEPLDSFSSADNIYYPKVALQNQQPDTITRSSMIRTQHHKLVYRPDDQSELYDLAKDPRELHNVYGQASYRKIQSDLFVQLMNWYVRTSDVAPKQLDPRGFPA
ncbi:MAG: sulfatase-like hydrolase/transferase [Acidobacteriota bacterium]